MLGAPREKPKYRTVAMRTKGAVAEMSRFYASIYRPNQIWIGNLDQQDWLPADGAPCPSCGSVHRVYRKSRELACQRCGATLGAIT